MRVFMYLYIYIHNIYIYILYNIHKCQRCSFLRPHQVWSVRFGQVAPNGTAKHLQASYIDQINIVLDKLALLLIYPS